VVIRPEVYEFFRGELVRRHVAAQRPAGGQRPDVDEQASDELVVGDRRVKHGQITRIHVHDDWEFTFRPGRVGREPRVPGGL
jgi:hypothetical protein